jgi:hypothetical protein
MESGSGWLGREESNDKFPFRLDLSGGAGEIRTGVPRLVRSNQMIRAVAILHKTKGRP